MLFVQASNKQDGVRLARGDSGEYYVYRYGSNGQVTKGKWFARHTEDGLQYVGYDPMGAQKAVATFRSSVAPSDTQFWTMPDDEIVEAFHEFDTVEELK